MIFKKYFWPFEFIIYAAILCASVKAETLDETRRRLAQFEEMTPPMIPVMLDFVDNRYPQNINYNLKELRDRLFQFLYDKRIRINDSTFTQGIRPLYFTISLSYFGSYKTESGIWGRKGIAELKYGNSPISNQSERYPITSDQLYGRKNKSTQEGWEGLTIGDLCESIAQKIIEISKFEERSYQEVTALGVSAIAEKEEDDKKASIADALRNVCHRAWGMEIKASTEITDPANVTDRIQQEGGCIIITYDILSEYTTYTSDGYCCVMVKAITSNK